jgi:alpha-D-xyloside xylohydrolase
LRDAKSPEDLLRRLQSVVLSPLALINAWYIKNPPWKQLEREANNADRLLPDWEALEAKCRAVMELRMRLVPYLHAAFVRYQRDGLPPFRALVMDWPDDPATWPIDNQWMAGESILVAPLVAGQASREVYLPAGDWFDFWTGKRVAGKQKIQVSPPVEQIPLFVKSGTILPLAEPAGHTEDPASWRLRVRIYGSGAAAATLYDEDGAADMVLSPTRRIQGARRYSVAAWEQVS